MRHLLLLVRSATGRSEEVQPPAGDGDLLTVLPRRAPVHLRTGRGYLVHGGDLDLVQAAVADDAS